ncbi:sigma-70 family RNA polymerase sigma factor [Kineosporia succinea]|uniref:RNA polymerase sigma factor (Sigma-70 family) n=1 Tax=Kineosporia succinea TaxID=84632 RepID=A0ABT9PD27_9ACTN|nr:sigma-70 family RNA polymerase sigma factor [Kineosporia succinea]MDP9830294.1 RNA polymerase sigma factor (sigma-70 family) [Kineosporia succinea]
MPTSHLDETARVEAARAGDRQALEEVLRGRLPFVYTIVRRAMGGSPEVDDVVQETMLRAVREVSRLSRPESFRAWLAAITIRQISTYQQRDRRWEAHTTALDDLIGHEGSDASLSSRFEDVTVLQLHLADQRHQLVRARAWLNPDDQSVLSLWWLEAAGELSRPDLAAALGVSVAHATVRVQRMQTQLALTRALAAAVEARPRCARLEVVLRDWDGRPGPLWRKRILRHTRSCRVCQGEANGLIAPETLLLGLALLPVPAALIGKISLSATPSAAATAGAGPALKIPFLQAVAAKPVAALLVTGTLLGGAVAVVPDRPGLTSTPPVVVTLPPPVTTTSTIPPTPSAAAPTPSPSRQQDARPSPKTPARATHAASTVRSGVLRAGPVSLEAADIPGFYASTSATYGVLEQPASAERATFVVVTGLANADCYSFRVGDGQYLRHSSWRVRVGDDDGTALFRGDATFCARTGSASGSVALEAANYPGWFLRHRDMQLWVDQDDDSAQFRADSSFRVRAPLSD